MNELSHSNRRWFIAACVGSLLVAVGIGYVIFQFRPKGIDTTSGSSYAKIEAMGFPLDAKSFAEMYSVPENENNRDTLYPVLAGLKNEFNKVVKANSKRPKENEYSFIQLASRTKFDEPDKKPPSLASRQRAHALMLPLITSVLDAAKRPHYVPAVNWNVPSSSGFKDLSNTNRFFALVASRATLLAQTGQSEEAISYLKKGIRVADMLADTPDEINLLTRNKRLEQLAVAAYICAMTDPVNALTYSKSLDEIQHPPLGRFIHGEVFSVATLTRIFDGTGSKDIIQAITDEEEREGVPAGAPSDKELPATAPSRAALEFALAKWVPIMEQIHPDGSIKDPARLHEAILAGVSKATPPLTQGEQLHSDTYLDVEMFHVLRTQLWEMLALSRAVCMLMDYKHRTNRLPETLQEAGISAVTPIEYGQIRLGYDGRRIWSVNVAGEKGITDKAHLKYFIASLPQPGQR